jgi:Fic family protein
MGKQYIWQRSSWPDLTWNSEMLLPVLGEARKYQGTILAKADEIGLEAFSDLVVEEVFSTSAIEGETFDKSDIRSSVAKRLGLPTAGLPETKRPIDGLVEILMDATINHSKPFPLKRLHGWHAAIFPTGYSGIQKIRVAQWRKGKEAMRVISGRMGQEKIHYEAPPANQVAQEVQNFLTWYKNPPSNLDGLIRAGIVHFWFVTIHPYDDGNGRISRALTDMAIAQDEKSERRLYSLSAQIVKERKDYYNILESSQKGSCDITRWLKWFLEMYVRAIGTSKSIIEKTFITASFWKKHSQSHFNDRQIKVITKLLEAEPKGFEGGITNKKYVNITRASRESAKRDLVDLEKKEVLIRNPGEGRSTSYSLVK